MEEKNLERNNCKHNWVPCPPYDPGVDACRCKKCGIHVDEWYEQQAPWAWLDDVILVLNEPEHLTNGKLRAELQALGIQPEKTMRRVAELGQQKFAEL